MTCLRGIPRMQGLVVRVAWLTVTMSCLFPETVFAGKFFDRAMAGAENSSPEIYAALSPVGKKLWAQIEAECESRQKSISLKEFCQVQIQSPDPIPDRDNLGLYFLFGAMQRPQISQDDLQLHFEKQRASLANLDVTFTFQRLRDFHQKTEPPVLHRFRSDGTVMWLTTQTTDKGEGEFQSFLYEESLLKKFHQPIDRHGKRHAGTGEITRLSTRKIFFPEGHPFRTSMLIDPTGDLSENDTYKGVIPILKVNWVYETPVTIDGELCLVTGNTARQCYCAINKGFAVVRNEYARQTYDRRSRRYRPSDQQYQRLNSDFHEVAEGIWLPYRSEYRNLRGGEAITYKVATLTAVQVGNSITAEERAAFFPEGTLIEDRVSQTQFAREPVAYEPVAYQDVPVETKRPSKTPFVKEPAVHPAPPVETKRQPHVAKSWNLSVLLVLCTVLAVLVLWCRKVQETN